VNGFGVGKNDERIAEQGRLISRDWPEVCRVQGSVATNATKDKGRLAKEKWGRSEEEEERDNFLLRKRERLSQLAFPLVGDIKAPFSCPGEKARTRGKGGRKQRKEAGSGFSRTCRGRAASEEAPVRRGSAEQLGGLKVFRKRSNGKREEA